MPRKCLETVKMKFSSSGILFGFKNIHVNKSLLFTETFMFVMMPKWNGQNGCLRENFSA